MRRTLFHHGLLLVAGLALAGPASAQAYPDRMVKFVAPTTPGPMADAVARVFAEAMSKALKQPTMVENRPGAEQIVGLEYIAKSAPADGYTVGVIGIDGQALLPLVRTGLRFDPLKDLTLVAGIGDARYLLATASTFPALNFKQWVAATRAAPGKYNYGSSTPQQRLYTMSLLQDLGLDVAYVPFPSGAPFLVALAAGTIEVGLIAEGTAAPVKSRIRIQGITGTTRSAFNPDVPTFAELGHPHIYGPSYALAVRTGTPQAVIDRLSAAAAVALASPEMKLAAQRIYFEANYKNQQAITAEARERFEFYLELTKKLGFKPE